MPIMHKAYSRYYKKHKRSLVKTPIVKVVSQRKYETTIQQLQYKWSWSYTSRAKDRDEKINLEK